MPQGETSMQTAIGRQYEVLDALAPAISELEETHRRRQRLWYPTELLSGVDSKGMTIAIPSEATLLLCLNTLTELGLPHFHRLLATHVGTRGGLARWTYMWTAEEDRHGEVLSAFLRRVRELDHLVLDRMRYQYLDQGFDPDWGGSPYQLIAYTVLQEVATRVAHWNIGKIFLANDRSGLRPILNKIAGDENRHAEFYRGVFKGILDRDPKGGVQAFASALGIFTMPGATIPGFADLEYLAFKTKVFDPAQFGSIVSEAVDLLGFARFADDPGFKEDVDAMRSLRKILRAPELMGRVDARARLESERMITSPLLPGWEALV
jgi:acyl-[acyl-carrier-protein] desaturase